MGQDRPSGFAASKGNLVKEKNIFFFSEKPSPCVEWWSGDVLNYRYICLSVSNICVKYQIHLYDSVN